MLTLKQTTQPTAVLEYELYIHFQLCFINLFIIPYTCTKDQPFKNVNVNMTMKLLLVSTSANIISEPSSHIYSHL